MVIWQLSLAVALAIGDLTHTQILPDPEEIKKFFLILAVAMSQSRKPNIAICLIMPMRQCDKLRQAALSQTFLVIMRKMNDCDIATREMRKILLSMS
ncbi:MAG: hypothetical protein LWW94_04200 [Candidatus Desulfofervidaceae bacterium]|nr:hypothetical protein [Candidatus Desulfofervidaceae bacterium]